MIKRAKGGSDFELDHLVALCRSCHAQTDAPYARGRLVVTPSGGGRFSVAVVCAPSKWEARQPPTNLQSGVEPMPQGHAAQATQEGTHP